MANTIVTAIKDNNNEVHAIGVVASNVDGLSTALSGKADLSTVNTFANTQYTQSIIPTSHATYDLGTSDVRWGTVYTDTCYAATAFYQSSDEKLKVIQGDIDLDKAYDLIEKCSTILYYLKSDPDKKQNIGVIAQEIQQYFPEIVSEQGEDHTLSVDYSKLTVILMCVMKDLIKEVRNLRNK